MAGLPLKHVIRDAFEVITVKGSGEPILHDQYDTAIRALNRVLDNWSSEGSMISGIGRIVYPIQPDNRGIFRVGDGAVDDVDIDVGGRVAEIVAVGYAYESGVVPDLKVAPFSKLIPGNNPVSYDGRTERYSVIYEPRVAIITFGDSIYIHREIVLDYKLEIDSLPVPPDEADDPDGQELEAILNTSLLFPVGYSKALSYGLAWELVGIYGKMDSPVARRVEAEMDKAYNSIKSGMMQPVRARLDEAVGGGSGLYISSSDRQTSQLTPPRHIDTTPHEIHTKDGTATWGVQQGTRGFTEMGSMLFNYGHAFTITFVEPVQGEYLWFRVPVAARASSLTNHGWEQLSGWTSSAVSVNNVDMTQYLFGPVGRLAAGSTHSYQLTLVAA